jgi:hypothetical protein
MCSRWKRGRREGSLSDLQQYKHESHNRFDKALLAVEKALHFAEYAKEELTGEGVRPSDLFRLCGIRYIGGCRFGIA